MRKVGIEYFEDIGIPFSLNTSSETNGQSVGARKTAAPFLKTFVAVFPDPTDRFWVSEDGLNKVYSKTF